jgi:hypothetical protein
LRATDAADAKTLLVPPHHVTGQAARIAFEDEVEVRGDADGARKDQQCSLGGKISNGTINDRPVVVEHDLCRLQDTPARRSSALLHRALLLQNSTSISSVSNFHADPGTIVGVVKSMD